MQRPIPLFHAPAALTSQEIRSRPRQWLLAAPLSLLLVLQGGLLAASGLVEPDSVAGLSVRKDSANVVLTWEPFVTKTDCTIVAQSVLPRVRWPHCEITLTNGWRFIYRNSMVNGYYAPDNFFTSDCPIHMKDFTGNWTLSQDKAVGIVKAAMARLKCPTNLVHLDFAPNVITASGNFKEHVPRLFFEWHYAPKDDLQSKVEAEVDADTGQLKSLYYDDVSYWGRPPPIDVPISIK